MANNEDDIKIVFGAEADESSAEQTGKKLRKSVEKGFGDDGRIKVPVDITVPIDNTKKKLTEAQKDITSEISKMMAKGFSASGKDIDTLTSKFDKFAKALDSAGKGRQNKIFREIRKQVEELQKSYKALKTETNSAKSYTPKATNTKKSTRQTARDRYLDQQEQYSKRAQGAGERAELNRELDEVRKNKSNVPSSGNIGPGKTNEHLMRLSEYSAHGSNWATELAKVLKEEIAKSAKTLVTYIDPNYKTRTKNGRATNEQEFLTDTMKDVRKQLKKSIAQLEAGSEDITLDTLKEQAAVIKVLTRALGKTTEDAEKAISSAIQSRYSDNSNRRLGGTDLEEGQEKGVGPGHENTQKLVAELYKAMKQWDNEVFADKIAKEITLGLDKTDRKTTSQSSQTVENIQSSAEFRAELNRLNGTTEEVFNAVRDGTTQTANINRSVKIGNTKEAVEDDAAEKISKEHKDIDRDTARTVKQDATTGFNTDAKADELITLVRSILQQIQGIAPKNKKDEDIKKSQKDTEENVQEIAKDKTPSVTSEAQAKNLKDYSMEMQKAWDTYEQSIDPLRAQMALTPVAGTFKNYYEGTDIVSRQRRTKEIEEERKRQLEEASKSKEVQKSTIYASPLRQGFWNSLVSAIEDVTGATREYEEVLKANADKQDEMAAERVKIYGLNNGRNPNDTGDIAGMRRILQLYRTNKASIEQNPELAQKIQLTPGIEVDTTEITKELNDALSGKNMRNAQMGGSIPRQILGGVTAFIGMPSLEKSRAQADGLNQILGNINKALQSVLINIQTKETELAGMEARGDVKFNKEGYIEKGTSAAYKTLADLEEEKLVLNTIRADLLANDEIIKRTGGRFSSLVKNLKFTSPVLKENNGILRNINSGLDKNGKALKFQTRTAEILNYTFQLMSRSIGQMIKNWLSMINPINIIKRLFNDFGSYNVKWQRTMNVIKNNFREIILPFMDKIAQTLVNIIGFLDIISMKIQEAFGYTPISLFDQENANEFKKTYEEISNVTAGFDELHDIGSSGGENDPDNLLGEIYKPQLSQEWIDLANKIGDLFADVIKGDLGFGEAMLRILEILGETLAIIAKKLWDWFKTTDFGKWLIENWKTVLATILALFLGWKLLKIFGPTLLSTIGGAFKTLLAKVGGWITTLLGASGFGQGIMLAFQSLLAGGKYSLIGTLKEMFTNSAAITQAGSWGSMIGFALTKGLLAVLGGYATYKITDYFGDKAVDNTNYNLGLMSTGGNEEDKKSNVGNILGGILGGAAGGAFTGGVIGGPIGAVIGGIIGGVAGTIQTVLRPALEEAQVAARNLNNELQNINFYEGAVQGATTQVETFTELEKQMTQAVEAQTNKVYAQGEQLGISKTRMDELIASVQNGTYHTGMLSDTEMNLASSLEQLSALQTKNKEATDQLTEAKRKLQAAEMDLAIAQDIEAEHYEVAAARIEAAFASGTYTAEEAGEQMAMLLKQVNGDMKANLLENMTPDMKKNFAEYVNTTDTGKKDLVKIYEELNDEQKDVFKQNYGDLFAESIETTLDEGQKKIDETELDWSHPFQSLGKVFGKLWEMIFGGGGSTNSNSGNNNARSVQPAAFATGTNYVPSDGLAYLHQGEAVIPKKYNQPYQPNSTDQAYIGQMIDTMRALDATIQQGIEVRGEFKQRGTDLVATVKKVENRNGNQPLNNAVFAR